MGIPVNTQTRLSATIGEYKQQVKDLKARIKSLKLEVDKYREQDVTADFNYRLEHEELQAEVKRLGSELKKRDYNPLEGMTTDELRKILHYRTGE